MLKRPFCTSRGRRDAGTWGSRDAQRCSTCNMNFGDLEAGNGFWNLEDFRGTLVSSCQAARRPVTGQFSGTYAAEPHLAAALRVPYARRTIDLSTMD